MNKKTIDKLALRIIEKRGVINLTRSELCKQAKIPERDFPVIMEMTFSDYLHHLELTSKKKGKSNPILRKAHIMHHALHLAQEKGFYQCRRREIAERAGLSPALITYHFGDRAHFRRSLMRAAVATKNIAVVAQGLHMRHPIALSAPTKLKRAARAQYPFAIASVGHSGNG